MIRSEYKHQYCVVRERSSIIGGRHVQEMVFVCLHTKNEYSRWACRNERSIFSSKAKADRVRNELNHMHATYPYSTRAVPTDEARMIYGIPVYRQAKLPI